MANANNQQQTRQSNRLRGLPPPFIPSNHVSQAQNNRPVQFIPQMNSTAHPSSALTDSDASTLGEITMIPHPTTIPGTTEMEVMLRSLMQNQLGLQQQVQMLTQQLSRLELSQVHSNTIPVQPPRSVPIVTPIPTSTVHSIITTTSMTATNTVTTSATHTRPTVGVSSEPRTVPLNSPPPVQQNAVPSSRPKLYDLPEFSGVAEEWPRFIAAYEETTRTFGYTDLENLLRLQKSLTKDARAAVESMMIHPQSVPSIIDALHFQFGRPELLIRSQVQKLRQIKVLTEDDFQGFINFALKIRNMATLFYAVKATQHLDNPMLLEEVVSKLPNSRKLAWATYISTLSTPPTLAHFDDWISYAARMTSLVDTTVYGTTSKAKPQPKGVFVMTNTDEVDNQPQVQERNETVNEGRRCLMCGDASHQVDQCTKFLDMNKNDRWVWVRAKNACFSCLKRGHQTFKCRQRSKCGINDCQRPHHQTLHTEDLKPNDSKGPNPSLTIEKSETRRTMTMIQGEPQIIFRVIPVTVISPTTQIKTYALCDEGSCTTLMEASLASELGLKGREDRLELQWYDEKVTTEEAIVVDCKIKGTGPANKTYSLTNVRAVKSLNLPLQTVDKRNLINRYPVLKDVPIAEYHDAKPRILIGLNNISLTVAKTVVECGANHPVAVETPLGWVIYGPVGTKNDKSSEIGPVLTIRHSSHQDQVEHELQELKNLVHNYCEQESLGVTKDIEPLRSADDLRAIKILTESIKYVDGHFQVDLLWKTDEATLNDNYSMALKRAYNLRRKLNRDPLMYERYTDTLMKFVEKGYAVKLSNKDISATNNRTWYLPHFGVVHPHKDKLRPVFDAAAIYHGESLNQKLLKGPDLNQLMLTVLFRFREGPVAVCADIAEMFLQVLIAPEDRKSQRFIWFNDNEETEIYEMRSMIFGATSSPCSAQFVKNFNAQRFSERFPAAVDAIINYHFADDYVKSFCDTAEAVVVSEQVKNIHAAAGFELRNFVSNSDKVRRHFQPTASSLTTPVNLDADHKEKILGLYWDMSVDEFTFEFKFHRVAKEVLDGHRPPSKRELLSLLMSVFDPFGFLADKMVAAKILLQLTWSRQIEWDDQLPTDLASIFHEWLEGMRTISGFRVPRYYNLGCTDVELHIFVDASELAMAVSAYRRTENNHGVKLRFVSGKTRTAPRKVTSIPRLELQAAVLGVRMRRTIQEQHTVLPTRTYLWTDSKTVLLWIKSEARKYRPFVMHRVSEILDKSDDCIWRWVPGHSNPADDGTRMPKIMKFDVCERWIQGPEFLLNKPNEWPTMPMSCDEFEDEREVRKNSTTPVMIVQPPQNQVIDFRRFSNYSRLLRTVAQVSRARIIFAKGKGKLTTVGTAKELSVFEVDQAEKIICRLIQAEEFSVELGQLRKAHSVDKSSPIFCLNPYLDEDGLIRCQGRIDAADIVPIETRRPIILPRKHYVTDLVVHYFHSKVGHQWQETVVAKIREKFWIPSLRIVLRRVISNCQWCRVYKAKIAQPMMGSLPPERLVAFLPPFTNVGLDYFGPVTVAHGRGTEKKWVALFCCMVTRAVHLELAHDYSTDALILCIRNFINIRGRPRCIWSDNGTNFIGFDREIKSVPGFFDVAKLKEAFAPPEYDIEWKFNCPADPSAGGVWERLVQSVKKTLNAVLKEKHPKEYTLRSLLYEAMNIVNSRPLTHVSVSSDDEPPLTPNHFLIGHTNSTQTPELPDDKNVCLRKQWRIAQNLKNHFWHRWVAEYLPTLTRRSKWHEKAPELEPGQLVLIVDPNESRNEWKRGRIVEVIRAADGQTRRATVKTSSGLLNRPAYKLAVLNVSCEGVPLHEEGECNGQESVLNI